MVRKHHDHTCDVYTLGTETVKGSTVQSLVVLYSGAKCGYWKKRSSYSETILAVQADNNAYEMNFGPEYPEILQGTIIVLYEKEYKVEDCIPHHRNGRIDNYQVFATKTTSGL